MFTPWRLASAWSGVSACVLLLGMVLAVGVGTACGGGDAAGPSSCSDLRISYDGHGTPDIEPPFGCDPQETFQSNATFDQFGRVTAYSFDWECADGDRDSGRLSNVQFTQFGGAISFDLTLNGASCGRYVCSYDVEGRFISCDAD